MRKLIITFLDGTVETYLDMYFNYKWRKEDDFEHKTYDISNYGFSILYFNKENSIYKSEFFPMGTIEKIESSYE